MQILQLDMPYDLTELGLLDAVRLMEQTVGTDRPIRLIFSSTYPHGEVLEVIFRVRGKLDIPFERSYALPSNAWMLVEDKGRAIFYSGGAFN